MHEDEFAAGQEHSVGAAAVGDLELGLVDHNGESIRIENPLGGVDGAAFSELGDMDGASKKGKKAAKQAAKQARRRLQAPPLACDV